MIAIFQQIFNSKNQDFTLATGDDVTDENMFSNLPSGTFKIKIGKKKTSADYYTRNFLGFISLLQKLVQNKIQIQIIQVLKNN